MEFLNNQLFGNSLREWLFALASFVAVAAVILAIKTFVGRRVAVFSKRTSNVWDNLIADCLQKIHLIPILVLSLYLGSLLLTLPGVVKVVLTKATILVLVFEAAILTVHGVKFWFEHFKQEKLESNPEAVTTLGSLSFLLRVVVWVAAALLALDNLGINITTLVAGLGITGIAVALAVQNVLGDLFASLSIVLDKPFVIGDFIIIDQYMGTIEKIGLKTTRIRSLSGEQLILSNGDLLKSRIRNYKRMNERRVVFSIGVTYQTPHEKIKAIPEMVKTIIERQEKTRFDRGHFKDFGAYALNYEFVYWMQEPDYVLFMNTQQTINLDIHQAFEQNGIEFAYPTQSVFVNASDPSNRET